jgi:hypothetical protein
MIPVLFRASVQDVHRQELGNGIIDAELRGGKFWAVHADNPIVVDAAGYPYCVELYWIDAGITIVCALPPGAVVEDDVMHLDWKHDPMATVS